MANGAHKICVLVLAAGESRRMGQPKALLRFGEQYLLDLALHSVMLSEIERSVLVLGAHEEAIRSAMWLDDVEIVVNKSWQSGMLSSVISGLRDLAANDNPDWVLVYPCDYALVSRESVARLCLRALASADNPPPIIAPSYLGRSGHPILLHRVAWNDALALPDGVGLDAVVQAHRQERVLVEVADPCIHFDVDTPEDYQRALEIHRAEIEHREHISKVLQGEEAQPGCSGPGHSHDH